MAGWRPTTEAEAASDRGLFIEWLRATGRVVAGSDELSRTHLAAAVELYVSVGDPVRAAAIRLQLLRDDPPARREP